MNSTTQQAQRDTLFTLAKAVNDSTYHVLVSYQKLYAALGTVEPLEPIIDEVSGACNALRRSVSSLTLFVATLKSTEVPHGR